MAVAIVRLTGEAAIFSDPESEEAKLQNLLLNIIGGLKMADLRPDEMQLLIRNGYKEQP